MLFLNSDKLLVYNEKLNTESIERLKLCCKIQQLFYHLTMSFDIFSSFMTTFCSVMFVELVKHVT